MSPLILYISYMGVFLMLKLSTYISSVLVNIIQIFFGLSRLEVTCEQTPSEMEVRLAAQFSHPKRVARMLEGDMFSACFVYYPFVCWIPEQVAVLGHAQCSVCPRNTQKGSC